MSPSKRKATEASRNENTTSALKAHLRAFEHAQMERVVRANADTPAGAAIRRRSSAGRADPSADRAPLVPRKPHWTTEERWEGEDGESREAWERRVRMAAAGEQHAGGGEGTGEARERKGSVRSRIGGLVVKALTGYVGKKDEFGKYAI